MQGDRRAANSASAWKKKMEERKAQAKIRDELIAELESDEKIIKRGPFGLW